MVELTQQQKQLLLSRETFEKFGYTPEDLSFGSVKKVIHKCIVCSKPKESYYKDFRQNKTLSHNRCKGMRIRQTCLSKYGVDNVLLLKEIQERIKQTCLERFGTENPIRCVSVQNKMRQTILQEYGVENVSQCEAIKEKKRQTSLEHFGTSYPTQASEVKEKIKQTSLRRYGKEHYLQTKEKQSRTKKTSLEKYGKEHPTQAIEVQKKHQQSKRLLWLKRRGVICSMENMGQATIQYLQQELSKEGYKLLSNEYEGISTKLKVECVERHIHNTCWKSWERGIRCPICNEPRHQRLLGEVLEQMFPDKVKHNDHPQFLGRLELDFHIEHLRLGIEYDGIQHYQPTDFGCHDPQKVQQGFMEIKERDRRKSRICKKNGYKLVRISYKTEITYENIKAILVRKGVI